MKKFGILSLLAIFCGAGVAHPESPDRYQVIRLKGLSPWVHTSAIALNNRGEGVGYAFDSEGHGRAFYWGRDRVPVDLGTIGDRVSRAEAINDGSYVVGYAGNSDPVSAFIWDPISRVKTELGVLGGLNGTRSWAKAINLKGQVAGYASSPSDVNQNWACLFEPGKSPVIIDQSGDCRAEAINYNGLVAGTYKSAAVVWENKVRQEVCPLGYVKAVNNSGQVVGYYYESDRFHGFIWDKFKGRREIPTLGGSNSFAMAINNRGQVVGRAETPEGLMRGFIWEEGKPITDINELVSSYSGSLISACFAINDRGDILAEFKDGEVNMACLLWPGTALPGIIELLLD